MRRSQGGEVLHIHLVVISNHVKEGKEGAYSQFQSRLACEVLVILQMRLASSGQVVEAPALVCPRSVLVFTGDVGRDHITILTSEGQEVVV